MTECSLCKEWYHKMCEKVSPSDYEKSDMEEWYCSNCMKNSLPVKL